jgi:hypothetical protein
VFVSSIGAKSIFSALIRMLCAATAAYCAIALSTELLARLTIARFWESWIRWVGPISALPVILIAAVSGFVFGLVLGFLFRAYPKRVASYAGLLAVIFMVLGGAGLLGLVSSVGMALGFVTGGAASVRVTRALSHA